jgi:hypothetical protein
MIASGMSEQQDTARQHEQGDQIRDIGHGIVLQDEVQKDRANHSDQADKTKHDTCVASCQLKFAFGVFFKGSAYCNVDRVYRNWVPRIHVVLLG